MCSYFKCKKVYKQVQNNLYNFSQLDKLLNRCNQCLVKKNSRQVKITRDEIGTRYSQLFFQTNGGREVKSI